VGQHRGHQRPGGTESDHRRRPRRLNRINAAALALKADGDERPIDRIRADLAHALLRGLALPDAVRDLLMSGVDDRTVPGEESREPARTGGGAADLTAAMDRRITEALAEVADEQLTRLLAQARMTGRLDGPRSAGSRSVPSPRHPAGRAR
jgi:hypothetical protein